MRRDVSLVLVEASLTVTVPELPKALLFEPTSVPARRVVPPL